MQRSILLRWTCPSNERRIKGFAFPPFFAIGERGLERQGFQASAHPFPGRWLRATVGVPTGSLVAKPYIKGNHHVQRVSTVKDEEFLELKELYLESQKKQQDLEDEIAKMIKVVNSLAGIVSELLDEGCEDCGQVPPSFPLKNGTQILIN